jgi:6-phosphogluconate dehydrogenase
MPFLEQNAEKRLEKAKSQLATTHPRDSVIHFFRALTQNKPLSISQGLEKIDKAAKDFSPDAQSLRVWQEFEAAFVHAFMLLSWENVTKILQEDSAQKEVPPAKVT